MAVRTVAANARDLIEPGRAQGQFDLEILDGLVAWLLPDENADFRSGVRLDPGETVRFESRPDEEFYLEAQTSDVEYQKTPAGQILNEKPTRRDVTKRVTNRNVTGGKINALRPVARVNDTAPGANTDIFSEDLEMPGAGTLIVKVALDGASVLEVQQNLNGSTLEAYDALAGESIPAGEGREFTIAVTGRDTYNFHVESAVTVSVLEVYYTKKGLI